MHLPAIAVLVAVLVGQLAALGSPERARAAEGGWTWLPRLAGALAGVAAAVALAWLLAREGRAHEWSERYRLAAVGLEGYEDAAARQRRIAYLHAAASLAPASAERQQDLADALYEAFRADRAALEQQARAFAERRLVEERLRPALECYARARGLCPLLPRPHVGLAAHAGALPGGDPASVHLDRALLVIPYNAQVWFLAGAMALEEGDRERAWRCWRRCLECSREYADEVVVRSRKHLAPGAIAADLLPADPELLYQAALLPGTDDAAARPFLERAVELARRQAGEPKPDILLLEARALARLGRAEEALRAYERLALHSLRGGEWRFEFAQLLHEQGRVKEARRELRTLLQQQPDHRPGKELYREVLRREGEGH
jgi:tetratricopeptide (TPR) repeat protein